MFSVSPNKLMFITTCTLFAIAATTQPSSVSTQTAAPQDCVKDILPTTDCQNAIAADATRCSTEAVFYGACCISCGSGKPFLNKECAS